MSGNRSAEGWYPELLVNTPLPKMTKQTAVLPVLILEVGS